MAEPGLTGPCGRPPSGRRTGCASAVRLVADLERLGHLAQALPLGDQPLSLPQLSDDLRRRSASCPSSFLLAASAVTDPSYEVGPSQGVRSARSGNVSRSSTTLKGNGRNERAHRYLARALRQLVPNERVVEVDEFETADPAMRGAMTITITLSDAEGGGPNLVAVYDGLPPCPHQPRLPSLASTTIRGSTTHDSRDRPARLRRLQPGVFSSQAVEVALEASGRAEQKHARLLAASGWRRCAA